MFVPPGLASWTSFDNGPQRADIYNMVPYKQTQLPDNKCIIISQHCNTVCPTCYQTQHFFNNSNTNEDIATKFEQEYIRCVRNEEECVCSVPNCCDQVKRVAYCRWFQTILAFWTTLGSWTRCGFTCRDTSILKIPIFGQVKIPTWYMKNPFIQRRLVFGVGCTGSA